MNLEPLKHPRPKKIENVKFDTEWFEYKGKLQYVPFKQRDKRVVGAKCSPYGHWTMIPWVKVTHIERSSLCSQVN